MKYLAVFEKEKRKKHFAQSENEKFKWYANECNENFEMLSIRLTRTGVCIIVCIKNRRYLRNAFLHVHPQSENGCQIEIYFFLTQSSFLCNWNTFHCQLFPIINSIR